MQLYTMFTEAVENHLDRTALQWEGGSITFREITQGGCVVGNDLRRRISKPSQNIALLLRRIPPIFCLVCSPFLGRIMFWFL